MQASTENRNVQSSTLKPNVMKIEDTEVTDYGELIRRWEAGESHVSLAAEAGLTRSQACARSYPAARWGLPGIRK